MKKIASPYNAAITGGGFLLEETVALLPLLQSPNRQTLIAEEKLHNNILHINAESSRSRNIAEICRRFDVMPSAFWKDFLAMDEEERVVANFFVILKTYKLLFDIHVNVTLYRWKSGSRSLSLEDIMIEFNEISSRDSFVDSWSDLTKRKVGSAYLTILRKVGMLGIDSQLSAIKASNLSYYLVHGEPWFLEACLLAPYEIKKIVNLL